MISKEEYKRELMRMYAWVRDDDTYNMKECNNFTGKNCNECPIRQYCFVFNPHVRGMTRPYDAFEIIEAVEKWSKEHPKQKFKVSQLEFDILQEVYLICGNLRMFQNDIINNLLLKGHFKGAYEDTEIDYYLKNCEVEDDV